MSGLSKTGAVLIAVFAICIIAFAAQVVYVLWWRRRFRRRSTAASELDAFSYRGGGTAGISPSPPPTKELLYFFFFCLENKQFRIEPATAPPLPPPPNPAVAAEPPIDDVALKLPLPSRGLFTIAEEREGSAADGTTDSFEWAVEIEGNKIATHEDQIEAVESCGDSDHYEDEATPFSTPCDSPPYYTPSPSPVRDDVTATSI